MSNQKSKKNPPSERQPSITRLYVRIPCSWCRVRQNVRTSSAGRDTFHHFNKPLCTKSYRCWFLADSGDFFFVVRGRGTLFKTTPQSLHFRPLYSDRVTITHNFYNHKKRVIYLGECTHTHTDTHNESINIKLTHVGIRIRNPLRAIALGGQKHFVSLRLYCHGGAPCEDCMAICWPHIRNCTPTI